MLSKEEAAFARFDNRKLFDFRMFLPLLAASPSKPVACRFGFLDVDIVSC